MSTRFFIHANLNAPISPVFSSVWDETSAANPRTMNTNNIDTTFSNLSAAEVTASSTNARDICARQCISDPIIGSRPISGTLKGQILMSESSTNANMLPQVVLRVISGDGTIVRGTLYAGDTRTTNVDELPTTLTNQQIPGAGISPVTLTQVDALDGDRIVAEIGARLNNTTSTTYTVTFRIGHSTTAADLSEGGSETTDLNPWIELSEDINFDVATQRVGMVPI